MEFRWNSEMDNNDDVYLYMDFFECADVSRFS